MKKKPTLVAIVAAFGMALPVICPATSWTTSTVVEPDELPVDVTNLKNSIVKIDDGVLRFQVYSDGIVATVKKGTDISNPVSFREFGGQGSKNITLNLNGQSLGTKDASIKQFDRYTQGAIGAGGVFVNIIGNRDIAESIMIDLDGMRDSATSDKPATVEGVGISLTTYNYQDSTAITIRDVDTIAIDNAIHGISLRTKNKHTNTLTIDGTDNLSIGFTEGSTTENQTRNGIISIGSTGSNTINISVRNQIDISNKGYHDTYVSTGVGGNGKINLSAKVINLNNHSEKSAQNTNGYLGSYSIRASALTQENACSTCGTYKDNSDVTLSAQTIHVDTNWGGILAQSSEEHHATATLKADDNMTITAAGSTTAEGTDNVVKDQHSAIKALSGGQESTVNLTAKNQLSLNYNTADLAQAQAEHDLLFAYGKNAAVNVTAGTLLLNDQKQAIRNVAKASQEGVINMTSESGGVIYGNMTADTHGQIHLNLGANTVFTGNVFDHSFAYKDPSIDGTIVAVEAGSISINGTSGAGWNALSKSGSDQTTYYSTVDHLTAASGVTGAGFNVSLAHDANEYSHLNVTHLGSVDAAKNGTVTFDLKFDGENQRDFVKVQDAVGQHAITVTYTGAHDKQAQDNLRQQWLVEDSSLGTTGKDGATFELTGGSVDIGVNKYELAHETGEGSLGQAEYWYLKRTDAVTPGTDTVESIAGSQRFLHWADMQDLRKRLGEIRYGAQDGAWVRAVAQKDKVDGTNGTGGLKQEYYGVHLGMDRAFVMTEEAMMLGGIDVVYGNAEQETRVQGAGSGDTDRYGMNVYATWAWDNGNYADVIFSGDYYKQSVTTHANDVQQDGKYNTFGLGASVEIGKMISFDASDVAFGPWYRQTWIEPQAQLSYYWLKGKNYALSEQGMDVSIDNSDSLIGRLGVVMGSRWNYRENYETIDRRYVQLSLKGGIKYDFLGGYDVTLNDIQFAKDAGRTTWYYGVGADWQLTDSTQCYAQFERESGDGYDKDYEVSVGVKMNF